MKNNIKAEIVAHSKRANTGEEIITYKLTFPRIILSEVNTYKQIEKNTSSSRAIPFEKMVEVVEKEPFIPLAWQRSHKGMQGTEYITNSDDIQMLELEWVSAKNYAIKQAKVLNNMGASKQICNRLLEPFIWVTQLCTGTRESFEHLFEQRCPIYNVEGLKFNSKKEAMELCPYLGDMTNLEWLQCNSGQAEIHFMDLAEKMYDALNESTPDILEEGDWHIPFKDEILLSQKNIGYSRDVIKMSVCLTAKVSYTKIGDENSITVEKAREMYERLKNSGHWSCFGHIAQCMTDYEHETWIKGKVELSEELNILEVPNESQGYCKNLNGFIPLRQFVEDNIKI